MTCLDLSGLDLEPTPVRHPTSHLTHCMSLDRSAFAVALAALALVSPLRAQAPETPVRFRDPANITGDPTGMRLIPPIGIRMPYPDAERAADHTAFPVVAYVVDTTGVIEVPTISFLDDTKRPFQQALCEYLPQLRYEPLVVAGQKMRVLVVESYGFNSLTAPDASGKVRSRILARQLQETFGTQPVENVIPELERRPHCDDGRGK
jgi:hypothetical protein